MPEKAAREFRTAKVSDNFYSIAMVLPLGEVAPGASKEHQATLFAGPQEEKKLEALAPGRMVGNDGIPLYGDVLEFSPVVGRAAAPVGQRAG